MAVQYHFAFSSEVLGAGIFAGGPYYCAQGNMMTAITACMSSPSQINLSVLEQAAVANAQDSSIDSLANIASSKVFLFSGKSDTTVFPGVMKQLNAMYTDYGAQITAVFDFNTVHGIPTIDFGVSCSTMKTPFINKCGYDGAGEALQTIYGRLNPRGTANPSNIIRLDQSKFVPGSYTLSSLSMGPTAYAYVPTTCKASPSSCKFHIAFHGCQQSINDIGDDYIQHTGFNEWAETNNIIVLYPQAVTSYFNPLNPNACWDWWGYVNGNYATKSGPQLVTVRNMAMYLSGRS